MNNRILLIGICISAVLLLTGCDLFAPSEGNVTLKDYWQGNDKVVTANTSENITDIDYVHEIRTTYRIGSYNIDNFDEVKLRNEPVVEGMAEVLKDYDVVAIQGIHDKTEKAFMEFMSEYMPNYDYYISVPLGRDAGYDQYAFIYNSAMNVGSPLLYPDRDDYFDKPPYMVEITKDGFTFILMTIEIKSVDAHNEIASLGNATHYAMNAYGDTDIIYAGDFSADCYYYDGDELDKYEMYTDEDTTIARSDCAYDRIFSVNEIPEVNIKGFVDKFEDNSLPEGLAEAMSSHYMVGIEMKI